MLIDFVSVTDEVGIIYRGIVINTGMAAFPPSSREFQSATDFFFDMESAWCCNPLR
jgi:hypothetical protein